MRCSILKNPLFSRPPLKALVILPGLALALIFGISTAHAGPEVINRVSISEASGGGNANSIDASVTSDGAFVVFESVASNLVAGDTNGVSDIFIKNTATGGISRVSTSQAGEQANNANTTAAISADGRYVVFRSRASNLLGPDGDTNGLSDIYLKDTQPPYAVSLVSTDSTESVLGNGDSEVPTISSDGRYVAFRSSASNLIGTDNDTNGAWDVFVRDTLNTTTTRVSTSATGTQGNADSGTTYGPYISGDGRYVAFETDADNLLGPGNDTNGDRDILVKDTQTGATSRASSSAAGVQANDGSYMPSISADGRYVLFRSIASNLAPGDSLLCAGLNCSDVFRKDMQTGALSWVSTNSAGGPANNASWDPHISADGRYASFSSDASNLAPADINNTYDNLVKDVQTGAVVLVSQNTSGQVGNSISTAPFVAAGGAFVAMNSRASNLTAGDINNAEDVFLAATSFAAVNSYFPWYDARNGLSWVLMANPFEAPGDLWFDQTIAGGLRPLPRWCDPFCTARQTEIYVAGQIPAGRTIAASFPGVIGGPVRAGSLLGGPGIVSERSLWPAGGYSLEEIPATESGRLSSHFYWPWYDQLSPGFANWVMVSNPWGVPIFYQIKLEGAEVARGSIAPSQSVARDIPGRIGGPVEVLTWSDSVPGSVPVDVAASQRVLSNNGAAFNEVPGIPVGELADRYVWTFYDSLSEGASNWIMVSNPGPGSAYYEIEVGAGGCGASPPAGTACEEDNGAPLAPGEVFATEFDNILNGPVRVQGYSNAGHTLPADLLASQRSIWGPSFEEVAGYPYETLASTYHWTWYDQANPVARNWVLIANPDPANPIYYEIRIAGGIPAQGGSGIIAQGGRVELTFPGVLGGPVQVDTWTNSGMTAPADSIVSQRVLWNGYFNEVAGTVLD